MSVPRIGQNDDGTWAVEGQPGSYPTRDMAARAAWGMPLHPVQREHGPTTGRDVLIILALVIGIPAGLIFAFNQSPKYRGDHYREQERQYQESQQPAAAVRQQPVVYQQPTNSEAASRTQQQIPPGCYYVIAEGRIYCPPTNRR